MKVGVLYFNRGTACYIRLLTSIFSLRKHYAGPITLLQEGELDAGIADLLTNFSVAVQFVAETDDTVLVKKSSLWREMPYDCAMFLDSDTIVRGPVDEFLEWTKHWGFVATWFNGWSTNGSQMRKRIEEWARVVPELVQPAIAYGKAINTGVQGWSKGAAILPAYEELTRRGDAAGCSRIMLDEIALQLLLPHHRHYLAHHVWNTSGKFGAMEQARIVHYHGKKHAIRDNPRCAFWKEAYFELVNSFPESKAVLAASWGDKHLARFFGDLGGQREDLTVVTAVDPRYAPKLRRTIKEWMRLPGLRSQPFLVFVNGFTGPRERGFLNYPNVRVVRWNYPNPTSGRREFMLAAFVFGVARHVKTPYWMKLDADCRPCKPWWEWPDYRDHTIVSHGWGFTRMKGETDFSQHWFNRLDGVFRPGTPYFKRIFDPLKNWVSHRPGNQDGLPRRFNSYCHIERTEFTRRIACVLESKNAGRLPIPSQDTISWYCAQIWQEKVKLMNMKHWFTN